MAEWRERENRQLPVEPRTRLLLFSDIPCKYTKFHNVSVQDLCHDQNFAGDKI